MTRIVTYAHRHKRPPRKRQAVALDVSAVVKAADPAKASKPTPPESAPAYPAIVTARRPGKRYVAVPDMTPEEHQRWGDAADALWREVVRCVSKEP